MVQDLQEEGSRTHQDEAVPPRQATAYSLKIRQIHREKKICIFKGLKINALHIDWSKNIFKRYKFFETVNALILS